MITHFKVLHEKIGICGKLEPYTKTLFEVSCGECIDSVIKKRLYEISLLHRAKTENKSVNQISKININTVMIRRPDVP
jgi:hypothetical protein